MIHRLGCRERTVELVPHGDGSYKLVAPNSADNVPDVLGKGYHVLLYLKIGNERPLLLHTEGGMCRKSLDKCVPRPSQPLCSSIFLFVALFLVVAVARRSSGYAAIFFLLVPELLNVILPNGKLEAKDSHMIDGSIDQNLSHAFTAGWACVTGQESVVNGTRVQYLKSHHEHWQEQVDFMTEFSAVWASTFILTICGYMLFYGCFSLYTAGNTLDMLNHLLRPRTDDSSYPALRLWKLHTIRSSVENKRFLEILAYQAFPPYNQEGGDIQCMQWWIDTRAAIYEDVRFNFSRRKPILGLCMVAEMLLIAVTVLTFVRHESDFDLTCYAVIYGTFLGALTLLFIFLCSQVNAELKRPQEILEDAANRGDSDSESPTAVDTAVFTGTPEQRKDFLDHEKWHPLQLRFCGRTLDLDTVKIYAAPLSGYFLSVACWYLQHLVGPFFPLPSEE